MFSAITYIPMYTRLSQKAGIHAVKLQNSKAMSKQSPMTDHEKLQIIMNVALFVISGFLDVVAYNNFTWQITLFVYMPLKILVISAIMMHMIRSILKESE